jgi:TonB family protein
MRLFAFSLVILLLGSTVVRAKDAAYERQLALYLSRNSPAFPKDLRNRPIEVTANLTIDRDGKLLDVEIIQGSGSTTDDERTVAVLRTVQPYPRIPDNVEAPYKFAATIVFVVPSRMGSVALKWPKSEAASAIEAAFRETLSGYLRNNPRMLPEAIRLDRKLGLAVSISIDRDGKLLYATVTNGSGTKALEESTLGWLKRLQPYPPIPSEVKAPQDPTVELTFGAAPIADDARIKKMINNVGRGC